MKRFFIKKTKEEVFIGKPLKISISNGVNFQNVTSNSCTAELMNYLISIGVVVSCDSHESDNTNKIPTSIEYYVAKLAKKLNAPFDACEAMLSIIANYSPFSVMTLLAKQISLELDHKYDGHIRDAEHVFALSSVDGTIGEVSAKVRANSNYKNFAAFRSVEDAKLAYSILESLYSKAF